MDATRPFSDAAQELVEILQERYPDGLNTSALPPKKTEVPRDPSRIEFAVLKNKLDPSHGWKPLKVALEEDTPASRGIQDNAMVAFAIRPEGADDEELEFEVDFPRYDDYADEEGEEEA